MPLFGNKVFTEAIKLFGQTLTDVLIKKGKCGHRHTQREDDMTRQGDGHLQAKESNLEEILPSYPSEGGSTLPTP